jgi:hypothetical protein
VLLLWQEVVQEEDSLGEVFLPEGLEQPQASSGGAGAAGSKGGGPDRAESSRASSGGGGGGSGSSSASGSRPGGGKKAGGGTAASAAAAAGRGRQRGGGGGGPAGSRAAEGSAGDPGALPVLRLKCSVIRNVPLAMEPAEGYAIPEVSPAEGPAAAGVLEKGPAAAEVRLTEGHTVPQGVHQPRAMLSLTYAWGPECSGFPEDSINAVHVCAWPLQERPLAAPAGQGSP